MEDKPKLDVADHYYVCPDHGDVGELALFIDYGDVHNVFCIKCLNEFLVLHVKMLHKHMMKKVMKEKNNG